MSNFVTIAFCCFTLLVFQLSIDSTLGKDSGCPGKTCQQILSSDSTRYDYKNMCSCNADKPTTCDKGTCSKCILQNVECTPGSLCCPVLDKEHNSTQNLCVPKYNFQGSKMICLRCRAKGESCRDGRDSSLKATAYCCAGLTCETAVGSFGYCKKPKSTS